ncbi:hypothetical protein F5878DRAFT_12138 [Lentinula raphanica]|uniref:RED-like N-terminal domain-containing protein n=1 Tax=Lentinula raphanica TaxID=153919 RepID=A0AA38PF57_9AGAR|nr:hypothetical protein F5878DRAFT_12138 [Lentinula raphanica]
MDQDSFRQLLSSGPSHSQTRTSQPQPRESLFTQKNYSKASTLRKSAPANSSETSNFKPRKVKKLEGKYRDRAAERRGGEGNDYAQVEAVLEEFEKRTADQDEHAVDEQRQYLGGDSDHSILVKGLDMALLQQNKAKAKAALATDEDEFLEQAFKQSSSSQPKKRTREDILRELKEKRTQGTTASTMESADETVLNKGKGKFKPIGFKPIGGDGEQKEKKKKIATKDDGERKKKKRRLEVAADNATRVATVVQSTSSTSVPPKAPLKLHEPEEPEPLEEFDIFAGVGEYEGVGVGDDDEEEESGGEENEKKAGKNDELFSSSLRPGQWFATDEQMDSGPPPTPKTTSDVVDEPPQPGPSNSKSSLIPDEERELASDEEQPIRLVPLSSSTLPSIKELLAIDEAAEAADKKHKRKNKKKGGEGAGGKKLDAEAKANRDYQRLKSYTEKRSGNE